MTSRYTPLFDSIALLEANHQEPDMINSVFPFPFAQMYRSQADLLSKIKTDRAQSFCIVSHTGWGKTPVFLSITRDTPSIIIEPRKFLQTQVAKYFDDTVLFGRSGYQCHHAHNAASAPCLLKEKCSDTQFHKICEKATQTCLNEECDIFPVGGYYKIYPCKDCEYISAQQEANQTIRSGGTVISNFGNFWNLLKPAKIVVIDEADLFFKEISRPMKLKYSNPKNHSGDSIAELMSREVAGLQNATKDKDAGFRYKMQNLLYSAMFLKSNADLCFKYQRKDGIYVEVDPRNVNILSQKLFKDKRVIIVSATPGQFDHPSYSASIHQRCGIYFAPVGNLTSRSLKQNPHLLSTAARAVVEISNHMDMIYDADRVVVHCGNIGTHATGMYKILGEKDCTLHESGKLAETIDTFLKSGKKYLLVAAAEYGGDFGWCKLQFILKFPYLNLDERMRTLERAMGPDFKAFYEGEARTRVIQIAGRNVRGFDDFGITVCLDSKVKEDFEKNGKMYPAWFQKRVDTRCY